MACKLLQSTFSCIVILLSIRNAVYNCDPLKQANNGVYFILRVEAFQNDSPLVDCAWMTQFVQQY